MEIALVTPTSGLFANYIDKPDICFVTWADNSKYVLQLG